MEHTIIDISVSPRSSRSRIQIDENGRVKIYLNSPPVDGKANSELIKILAKASGVGKSQIEIIRGKSGRKKTVSVTGIGKDELMERLRKG